MQFYSCVSRATKYRSTLTNLAVNQKLKSTCVKFMGSVKRGETCKRMFTMEVLEGQAKQAFLLVPPFAWVGETTCLGTNLSKLEPQFRL